MQMIKCTSPCFPKCEAEASQTLKSLNGTFLGHNCEEHIPKKNAKDYIIEEMKDDNAE